MNFVVAIIKPFKLDDVRDALSACGENLSTTFARWARVPTVYLTWANSLFLAFFTSLIVRSPPPLPIFFAANHLTPNFSNVLVDRNDWTPPTLREDLASHREGVTRQNFAKDV